MPRPAVLVASAVALTAALVGGGVLALGDSDEPEPEKTAEKFTTTPLSSFDTTGLVVARASFCGDIDDRQVTAALDGEAGDASSWSSGDSVNLGHGTQDVANEFGCRYAAADGTLAQAWVFAPPVGAEQAQQLVTAAQQAGGCQPGSQPFGSPTLALTCTAKDGSARASYRGLFGDAWLVCEVDRPAGATWDVTDRAGRWCVGVLEAARVRT